MLTQCSPEVTQPNATHKDLQIQLMTSLPIIWGENGSLEAILSGAAKPSPIYSYWKSHYQVEPVDSLQGLLISDPDIVLLAQPPAMDPADIADLDRWVRQGGDVIILADPLLVWPSELPMGDVRRPLSSSLLGPLLNHWGLELTVADDQIPEPVDMEWEGIYISVQTAGAFALIADRAGENVQCRINTTGFVAQCRVGKGRAILVSDADFINISHSEAEEDREADQLASATLFMDRLILGLHHQSRRKNGDFSSSSDKPEEEGD